MISIKRLICTVLVLLIAWPMVGCGPSKEDLMMRAAMRKRPPSGDEKEQAASSPPPAKAVVENRPVSPPPARSVAPPPARMKSDPASDSAKLANSEGDSKSDEDTGAEANKEEGTSLVSVVDRRPEKPMAAEERRAWAFKGLSAVGQALREYTQKNNQLIKPYSTAGGGVKTLSWRVEILPYLGYQELYDKFDFNTPWYLEPNKSLLKFIPDEFVSPERFDTKTNLQLPVGIGFLFSEKIGGRLKNVEDGLENTLMLVEADDKMAVEWTAPEDFDTGSIMNTSTGLGSLRSDGTFAVWGNGWTTALPKTATDLQLKQAFSAQSGDPKMVTQLHRRVKIEGLSEGGIAAMEPPPELESDTQAMTTRPAAAPPVPEFVPIAREAVPNEAELSKSRERLRKLYSGKMVSARNEDEKLSLSKELLKTAGEVTDQPADAYVLMTAAEKLAIDAGSVTAMLQALDSRVGRFELDPYQESVETLSKFHEVTASRSGSAIDESTEYVKRAVRVIYASIAENDFMRGSYLSRICSKLSAENDSTDLRAEFNRLRSLMGGANNAFEDAKEHLTTYRINPDNVDAGAKFGQFLCFFKGDWETGLELIAKSSNKELAQLAQDDMKGGATVDDQVALGDAWWELSKRTGGVYRQGARDRAVMWYRRAFPLMPQSLDRIHVENQLQEAEEDMPSSPTAACEQLAESLGVDLRQSLAELAIGVQRPGVRKSGKSDKERG